MHQDSFEDLFIRDGSDPETPPRHPAGSLPSYPGSKDYHEEKRLSH